MAGPNYISYNDWEAESGDRRKRRRIRVALLICAAIAMLLLIIPALINKLESATEHAGAASSPSQVSSTAPSGDNQAKNDSSASTQSTKSPRRALRQDRRMSPGARFAR